MVKMKMIICFEDNILHICNTRRFEICKKKEVKNKYRNKFNLRIHRINKTLSKKQKIFQFYTIPYLVMKRCHLNHNAEYLVKVFSIINQQFLVHISIFWNVNRTTFRLTERTLILKTIKKQ